MALKLVSITFSETPRIPGLSAGSLTRLICDKPNESLRGWTATVKGRTLILTSPPGWHPGTYMPISTGPRQVWEIPRQNCFLQWEGSEEDTKAIFDMAKTFESPPFGLTTS